MRVIMVSGKITTDMPKHVACMLRQYYAVDTRSQLAIIIAANKDLTETFRSAHMEFIPLFTYIILHYLTCVVELSHARIIGCMLSIPVM